MNTSNQILYCVICGKEHQHGRLCVDCHRRNNKKCRKCGESCSGTRCMKCYSHGKHYSNKQNHKRWIKTKISKRNRNI